jgi:hypothetical protein
MNIKMFIKYLPNSNQVIAAATLGAFIAAYLLFKETQKQVIISQTAINLEKREADSSDAANKRVAKAAEMSAIAAIKSASLAEKSVAISDSSLLLNKRINNIAQTNFKIENRPYIVISEISVKKSVYNEFIVGISLKNIGKTPANVRSVTYLEVSENAPIPNFKTDFDSALTMMICAGEVRETKFSTSKVTSYLDTLIRRGKSHLFIYCEAVYEDYFHEHHFTHISAVLDKNEKDIWMTPDFIDAN